MGRGFRTNILELDVTYRCTLRCANCTRRCDLVPGGEEEDIHLNTVQKLIDTSIGLGHVWGLIFLIGGEPTLHPKIQEIAKMLVSYGKGRGCEIRIVSNMATRQTVKILRSLPPEVRVVEAPKTHRTKVGALPKDFWTMNVAPRDLPEFEGTDFSVGCKHQVRCGLLMRTNGKFLACPMSSGIDRIFDNGISATLEQVVLPEVYKKQFDFLCGLCGRFRLKYNWTQRGGKESVFESEERKKMFEENCKKYPLWSGERVLTRSWEEVLSREDKQASGIR